MKPQHLLSLALLFSPLTIAQAQEAEKVALSDAGEDFRRRFTNLPDEQKKEYYKLIDEIRKLFSQKRVFETLAKIEEAEKIIEDHPALINFRGACYVEFRDFEQAKQSFKKALEIEPNSTSIKFNAAELEFVTKNWKTALEKFQELEKDLTSTNNVTVYRYIVQFKILLCYLSIGNETEYQKYLDLYDYETDSPYYYYANAVKEFKDGNDAKAQNWINRAARIFRNPATLSPWQDTLIEFGYVKSFYGSAENATVNE